MPANAENFKVMACIVLQIKEPLLIYASDNA